MSRSIFLLLFILIAPGLVKAQDVSSSDSEPEGFGLRGPAQESKSPAKTRQTGSQKKAAPKKKKKTAPKPPPSKQNHFGIGATGGWEAPYGNGATFHMILSDFLDLNGGVGYNNSGLKFGAGGHLLLSLGESFAIRMGASLVRSQGRSGEVSLDAKFIPEGSSTQEAIEVSKNFTVEPSLFLSPVIGVKLDLGSSFSVLGGVNYNVIISGNEIKLGEGLKYNKNIELTNEDEFSSRFDQESKKIVQAGGIGFHVGLILFL